MSNRIGKLTRKISSKAGRDIHKALRRNFEGKSAKERARALRMLRKNLADAHDAPTLLPWLQGVTRRLP